MSDTPVSADTFITKSPQTFRSMICGEVGKTSPEVRIVLCNETGSELQARMTDGGVIPGPQYNGMFYVKRKVVTMRSSTACGGRTTQLGFLLDIQCEWTLTYQIRDHKESLETVVRDFDNAFTNFRHAIDSFIKTHVTSEMRRTGETHATLDSDALFDGLNQYVLTQKLAFEVTGVGHASYFAPNYSESPDAKRIANKGNQTVKSEDQRAEAETKSAIEAFTQAAKLELLKKACENMPYEDALALTMPDAYKIINDNKLRSETESLRQLKEINSLYAELLRSQNPGIKITRQ